ncbi:MAG: 5-(carboxyamino)imidazole ribonucleotide synthase [Microbacteriaceae bacterium]|jgi:5-(carboxyamino)imidazole ribonucleotide synthase|nr:5-(carboxyamino)imidazole ribonucleotide synthase [Microbacteriaceae bacterium]MCI1206983.1 5-(carboxyamino)imidazole ribonucleotide synthase [Microbacteriaceae bacterium]
MTFTVGVIGAGQLARMMIPAAVNLDIDLRVFGTGPGESAALAQTATGDWTDLEAVRAFAADVDVLTFEHEHVPQQVLRALEDDGVAVRPGSGALLYAQDKLQMRTRMAQLGLPNPEWAAVQTADEVSSFLASHGGTAIAKQPTGGYDGHGVRRITSADEVSDWLTPELLGAHDGALLLEELVPFTRELSQLVARRPSGDLAAWPLTETIQSAGVCSEAIAPAPGADAAVLAEAARIASTIASELDVVGVLAVELFETADGRLLVNELAMRPHNSGHWTIDGSVTGQFEQHLRAVLDLPLGSTELCDSCAVMVNVLGGPETPEARAEAEAEVLRADPAARLHWYGKGYRPHRKVGHINAFGTDVQAVLARARRDADLMHRDSTSPDSEVK